MRILHLHSSFAPGGKELRAVRLMNLFGPSIAHTVVSAQPGAYGAKEVLARSVEVDFPLDFPSLQGKPTLLRLLRIARAMRGFDLVLTYNWGAMDGVLAHRLFARGLRLPPLVHHEDGFNEDEAKRLKPSRNMFRRVALANASALVVPSKRLERIALSDWKQPPCRVRLITNGIPTAAFADHPPADAIPGLRKDAGEFWVGTLAGLRAVKNLPRMVRAFARLPEHWRLVIVGEGPERTRIEDEARACGVAARVFLPGFVPDPARMVGLFDMFALSSDSEQFPISVVEAMAAGLPVVSPAVGDVAGMVAEANRPFIVPAEDEAGLAAAMTRIAHDEALRLAIGEANRLHARSLYDEEAMVADYARTYGKAMGRHAFP